MAQRRWVIAGIAVVVIGVVASVLTYLALPEDDQPPTATGLAGEAVTPVCGFSGDLLTRLVADEPAETEVPPLQGWDVGGNGGGSVITLAVHDDAVTTVTALEAGGYTVAVHDRDGAVQRSFDYDFDRDASEPSHNNGRPAVAPDGSVYAVDSYDGRRALVRFDERGDRQGSWDIPASEESTDHPLDLQDVVWVSDYDGAPALLVGEGQRTVHAFRLDGESLGLVDGIHSDLVGVVGESTVAGLSGTADESAIATLTVTNATTGQVSLQLAGPTEEATYGMSSTPLLDSLTAVLPGPEGEGTLLVQPGKGIEWVGQVGVRKAIWLSSQNEWEFSRQANATRADGSSWFVIDVEGSQQVLEVDDETLAEQLTQPVATDASSVEALAQLGLGLGAVTSQPFNHFDYGTTPSAAIRFEDGWGMVGDERAGDGLEIRYSVAGDPTLADAVFQDERTLSVSVGGGETELELPKTRPGPYEVDIALVDKDSDDIVAGTCLRYSVGAEGADLDLDDLAEGADWGGAGPLRGVQLADRLGIGSHRIQLDFGSLVADPAASPTAAGINWGALPGATGDTAASGFAGISQAATYASTHGVDVIVQVGGGGEAEIEAVESETWGEWIELLVSEFDRQAPTITLWSPWNEPNSSYSALTGAEFAEQVDLPFAEAAHSANPQAQVLAGNTLGFADDWWADAASTSLCESVDGIAVHPYTGWNRSWEEEGFTVDGEGFDRLRDTLGESCADLPVWDTESGWWADGQVAYWGQGSNVARKLLWYPQEDVAGWTYFFSEGGWGEGGLSWSLMQYGNYIKPGGLSFAAVSRLLSGDDSTETVETDVPFTTVMDVPGDEQTVAAWTAEARIGAVIETDADEVTITDHYGARSSVAVEDGTADITLTAGPQFVSVPSDHSVSIKTSRSYGVDLLEGQTVTASSTHEETDAQVITSGTVNPYRPWRSGRVDGDVDEHPSVEIPLAKTATIDSISVATGSIACCEAGLRDYTVSVQTADGSWETVATQEGQYWERVVIFDFEPVEATAVRVEVPWTTIRDTRMLAVNYSGMAGGLPTPFMGLQTESDYMVSIAAISAWEAIR